MFIDVYMGYFQYGKQVNILIFLFFFKNCWFYKIFEAGNFYCFTIQNLKKYDFLFKDFEIRMIFIFFAIYFFSKQFCINIKIPSFYFCTFFVLYFKIKDFFLILLYWILFNPKKQRGKKLLLNFCFNKIRSNSSLFTKFFKG